MTHTLSETESRADATDVVLRFFQALHDSDQVAVDLLDDAVDYVNVSASRLRGARAKKAIAAFLALGSRSSAIGFDVVFINIAQDDGVVLTERLDTLKIGPLWTQFWVLGRLEVKKGKITVWRDYFDYVNVTLGLLRGLVGAVAPIVRPKLTHQVPLATRSL